MERLCILHIGTEKTGTTALQMRLVARRARLARQGLRYPEALGTPSHRALAVACQRLDPGDDGAQALGAVTAPGLARLRATLAERLGQELDAWGGCDRWLISSEHLHSRLRTEDEVARVRDLLAPHFDEIVVVLHLRPQIDMLVSLASTAARVGQRVDAGFLRARAGDGHYCEYLRLWRLWANVFGAARLKLVAFRRSPDIGDTLERLADADLAAGPKEAARMNAFLDIRALALVNAAVDAGRPLGRRSEWFDALRVVEQLRPGRGFAAEIQRRFDADNARLVELCPDLVPGDLDPAPDAFPERGNLHLLERRQSLAAAWQAIRPILPERVAG
ncbi:hypothetical protein E2L08_02395 [Palleronia sediminis]|uniref:Sulfotransferase family protein n=1 Tax=Palleronia sediminis TaxID=2547833 RepID=A0A4R6AJJ4_9RHOB|nr:hypothetical protein [Palleronia sediminis]TDL83515.1 hypothetical protein E2L08_02395 [Palleronia sediminis]